MKKAIRDQILKAFKHDKKLEKIRRKCGHPKKRRAYGITDLGLVDVCLKCQMVLPGGIK